jgi:tRNA A-37 threonylcarbamoyl transferase component Bud32
MTKKHLFTRREFLAGSLATLASIQFVPRYLLGGPGHQTPNETLTRAVIGVGGMGSVYRARDLHFPNVVKLVAVKEMINQARDPLVRQTIIQNFEREANILVTLNHASIPRIYDYFTNADRAYLVLEYIHGKDLEAILGETTEFIDESQVVSWAIELCDVLEFLHNHKPEPIIFRDMKPSNIMINTDGHVVLVDFGIAKIFRSGQKGTMIGTEGYPYYPTSVSWMMHSIAVKVSDELTPSVYPVVHPIYVSLSNATGGSWALVIFFGATWLSGYAILYRGRSLFALPLVIAIFILAILVFISRV